MHSDQGLAAVTGQHSARNGMWHVIPWYGTPWAPVSEPPFVESLPRDSFTVAKGLKSAGYATAWKLIDFFGDWFDPEGRYVPGARIELYDLRKDIGEMHDLSAEQPERAAAMKRRLLNWMASVPAEIPSANPHHDPSRPLLETKQKPDWYPRRQL